MTRSWFFFPLFIMGPCLEAQPHNEEIYQEWWKQFSILHSDSIGRLAGELNPEYFPIIIDSLKEDSLYCYPVFVNYRVGEKKTIIREMNQSYFYSLKGQIGSHQFQDTLKVREFRKIFRESPDFLKGENPRWKAKWGLPLLGVAQGLGVVFLLFYVRSR